MHDAVGLTSLSTLVLASMLALPSVSARVLFYDPAFGDPSLTEAGPSPATGLTPVGTTGTQYVGVHYWFENGRGDKFADPIGAGAGSRVTLHVRGNTSAFLTVWMSDSGHASVELTSRTHAGPEGRWTGYLLAADQELVVAREFVVDSTVNDPERVIIFLARSQTEQVDSMSGAREKLERIAARNATDDESVLVRGVDRSTPGQIGTYIVHRAGGQTGGEIVMTSQAPRAGVSSLLPVISQGRQ
jgi:hypothetical protein